VILNTTKTISNLFLLGFCFVSVSIFFYILQEAASIIKEQFENLPGGGIWHCLVGRNFGCFVDHQEEHFIYFYVGQIGICIFKTV
tara:strand:+ start:513 stop:767 length:255 start_codon:yes stop_codon:yes gene_type:complete